VVPPELSNSTAESFQPANKNPPGMGLLQSLSAAWPPHEWSEITVLVAVSGGPDSVALLRGMAELKAHAGGTGRLIAGHFDHRLRPESVNDARFVVDLAQQLSLPFELGQSDVGRLAALQGDGVEAAAREARYTFLQRAAEQHGARYVATAHSADDQVETVLFNILRGTGLSGLAGMERARPLGPAVSLIRPLLAVRRAEVLAYLDEIRQPCRTDPTNASADFARNRLRNELLPLLRENFNPDVDGALNRLSRLAGDAQRLIEKLAEELLDRCTSPGVVTPGLVQLNVKMLCGVDRHLIREMFIALWRRMNWPLQNMGFAEWDELAEMAPAPKSDVQVTSSKRVLPGNVLVERRNELLSFRRRIE
jgi:tRNA(Ile)-lysidine synthase